MGISASYVFLRKKKVSFAIFNPFWISKFSKFCEIWFQFWDKIYFYLCEKILNDLFFYERESKAQERESKARADFSFPLLCFTFPLVKKKVIQNFMQKRRAGLKVKDSVEGLGGTRS